MSHDKRTGAYATCIPGVTLTMDGDGNVKTNTVINIPQKTSIKASRVLIEFFLRYLTVASTVSRIRIVTKKIIKRENR